MRDDPGKSVTTTMITLPPAIGPGSGKEAWRALALRAIESNASMAEVAREQGQTIAALNAEIEDLRQQIASRKPKGGRPPLNDDTIRKIEVALIAGASTRQIAQRYKVSAMTVSRIKKRVDSRQVDPA